MTEKLTFKGDPVDNVTYDAKRDSFTVELEFSAEMLERLTDEGCHFTRPVTLRLAPQDGRLVIQFELENILKDLQRRAGLKFT